jgi:hypothetical protein
MSNPNIDEAKQILLEIQTLEKEYDVLFSQYDIAFETYKNALLSNPCIRYKMNDTNISNGCYKKIWSDQGCSTSTPTLTPNDVNKTYNTLVQETYEMSKSSLPENKTKCYGTGASNPKPAPIYSHEGTIYSSFDNKEFNVNSYQTLSNVTNKESCNLGCAIDTNCKAALFIPGNTASCQLYNTFGQLKDSSSKSVLITLTNLRTRLAEIIELINTKIQNPKVKEYMSSKEMNLNKNIVDIRFKYEEMLKKNSEIEYMFQQYNTANTDYEEQKIFVSQQNLSYRFWTIAAIIFCIIIVKQMFGIDIPSGNTMFWATLIIVASFTLSKPSGFAMMGFLLIIFLLISIKDYFTQQ